MHREALKALYCIAQGLESFDSSSDDEGCAQLELKVSTPPQPTIQRVPYIITDPHLSGLFTYNWADNLSEYYKSTSLLAGQIPPRENNPATK